MLRRPSFHRIKGTRHGHRPDHWCQPGSPQGAWQVSPSPLEGRPLHGGGEQLHSLTGTLLSSPDSLLTSAGTRGYLHCIRVIIQHLILFFAHSSSFGCWELSYSSCISFTYPIFVGFCIFFFFSIPFFLVLEDTPGRSWGLPVPALESAISPGSLAPLPGNEWSWKPRPGRPCAPSLWTLLANRTTRRVCANPAHTHTADTPVCNPAPHYTAPESSLMPSSPSYPRVALPSVACDLPPALRLSAPTRRLCGPRAGAAGTLLLTRARGNQRRPQGTVLCARPGPSRLQTPLTATGQLTGLWLGPH